MPDAVVRPGVAVRRERVARPQVARRPVRRPQLVHRQARAQAAPLAAVPDQAAVEPR